MAAAAAAAAAAGTPRITIEQASPQHLPSLSTIFARSFHPNNAYMKKCFPDTPLVREWWTSLLGAQVADPANGSRVLVAVDGDATDPALAVVGFILLRRLASDSRGSGVFSTCEYTPDHAADEVKEVVDIMTAFREGQYLGKGRDHIMVEVFGVDATFKGGGVGSRLLRRACEIADEQGVEMCVQANASAFGFYEKVGGFEERERIVLEGGYREHMMVRPARGVDAREA